MSCNECGEKPKKACGAFPKAVIEIDNPEKIVLLRKVLVPASMGDESTFPPTIGKYHNVLLEYEASGGIYLYSSDGIPTKLSSDVTELQAQLNALRVRIGEEEVARADADTALSDRITSLDDSLATVARTGSYNDLSDKPTIGNGTLTIKKNGSNVGAFTANATTNTDVNIVVPTKTSDLANDGSDGASTYVESNDLATVATSGSYNDLTNKPTIGNATLTIKRNGTNAGTFTANATTNKSINIAVPTKTSDLTNDGADGTSTYVEADDLPTVDATYSSSSNNAIANSTVTNSLDRNVMTNLAVDSTPSTTTVNLSNTKTNLAYPSSSTTSSISLPVASSTQAGVMNSATFDAVTNNTNNINAILNGAVAISNLPASPTQAQLTTAWENETGLTSLINRASVYDVTNNKVWTYYTNDQTWHAASNTSQVTVNTFTNSSEGTIKGSTNDGQVFAENDGTGSVNGWDALTSAVSSNTSKLATIAQGAEVNVQANWTQTNTNADDYIKNKPANLVQDANYVHTDNNFTTTLKNKLDGIESGAEVNVQADWSQTDTSADDYIKNKPTIPTVNNATLTIQKNGTNVQTFTANSSTNKTANITVPTAVSELTNDSGYATTTQLNNGLATKQDTLTAGDNIQINGNTISATDTTYTAGNAIDITNGEISADIHPADFFTAEDIISDCGSDLSLDDTMTSTLRSVELKGDTYQQTYSGKNLLLPSPKSSASSGLTASYDATTGVVTLSGTASNNWSNAFDDVAVNLPAGTYTFSATTEAGLGRNIIFFDGSTNVLQKSLSATATSVECVVPQAVTSLRLWLSPTSGTNYTGKTFKAQLEIGSQATSFEPYVGGVPAPNPDYPQNVQVVTGEQTVTVVGKNLLAPYQVSGSLTTNGMTFTMNSDGTMNINGTASANTWLEFCGGFKSPTSVKTSPIIPLDDSATYILSTGVKSGSFTGSALVYIQKDYPNSETSISLGGEKELTGATGLYRAWMRIGSGATFDNAVVQVQLEKGSTATTYEPYQAQSYEINLGKNLFDVNGDFTYGGYSNQTTKNGDGTITTSSNFSTSRCSGQKLNLLANTTYTLSCNMTATTSTQPNKGIIEVMKGIRNVNMSVVARVTAPSTGEMTLTFTTPEDVSEIWVNFNSNGAATSTFADIQIEQGSTATGYAPYFTPVELCKIGDYQDYIYKSGDDWYLHKEIENSILKGTEDWYLGQSLTNTSHFIIQDFTTIFTGAAVPPDDTVLGYCLSDHFEEKANLYNIDQVGIDLHANKNLIISVPNSVATLTADFKTWLSTHNTTVYYALATPVDIQITGTGLVAQLNALAGAKSYNDQTNIIVTTAGDNLPATLCVETYRKSLSGVIEAIDNACTCRKNLVVYLPNGMTTYTNNDAPIPIPEVIEALKRGRSVFLVYGGLYESVYVVTAASAEDGVYSMRADQTGVNPRGSDGHWHISGGGDVWDSVTFINDATPSTYSPNIYDKTWFTFTSSTPLLDQNRRTYYPASRDVTFNNGYGRLSVAELWEKLASSAWDGNPVVLEVPLQEISTRTTNLVDVGFTAENPLLTISVSLGPDSYFEREASGYTITGWAAECTPITFDGKEAYAVGIVRVVGDGNTDYRFVVSLTEVNSIN